MINHLKTASGVEIAWTGPPLENGPLPAFFYFALTADESLTLDPFNQPIQFLADKPIRCFSVSLPMHEDKLTAITKWAEAIKHDEDILTPFIEECVEAVDYVIGLGITTEVTVGGLSRGGFISLHIAARHNKVNKVLGFAPVTNIGFLESFSGVNQHPIIVSLEPKNLIPNLVNKKIRFYVGNRDERVGTRQVFDFVEEIVEKSVESGVRNPPVELIITPSIGFKGHGTQPEIFADGAAWVLKN